MGIDSHGNNGHSHSHTGCFPFLPIPLPNFVTNSHSHWESHSHGHLYFRLTRREWARGSIVLADLKQCVFVIIGSELDFDLIDEYVLLHKYWLDA